ncbi:NAD-dependent succinate-semialdehyde dehydrogenase [Gordonia sp. TBRC 11910]|uniref:NAD-dependent succinate-semialdehyde dehydrogenase n=1 Tax=Gordonia asplenii TaxID=2725283 RepID=A0A848KZG8_9ACTN|nr:NAD-dependent succinate-semialdehyde dehydrogenase [Gordonia asplenii]NMO02235.1 NAD-dependent succinate-semialdehyde dehydrogenase [Gordonia asplenii]
MSQYAITNPATGIVEARYPAASDADVDHALAATAAAYRRWRTTTLTDRAAALNRVMDLLEERKQSLAETVSREMGKRIGDAVAELDICIAIAGYYADNAEQLLADSTLDTSSGGRAFVRKTPVGPLLGVMPWNYPYYQVFRFVAPNLMAGNTVVIKHASQCPASAAAMAELFADAGLPDGAYVNLFATHEQIERIVADDRIVGVSLTGSERAGARIAALAGRHLKKVVLELGGSDPYLILDVADMADTVVQATKARLGNAGQSCNGGKRFIVLDHLYDQFVEQLTESFAGHRAGDPFDPACTYGPLSSAGALDELDEQVVDALQAGAKATVGARRSQSPGGYEPTVLIDVPTSARAYYEELFGPVAVVHVVDSIDAAVDLANDTPFGLGAAVFHRDEALALEIADRLDAGMVFINTREGGGADLPFGGTKKSGFGRELGPAGIDEFVNKKLIHLPPAD